LQPVLQWSWQPVLQWSPLEPPSSPLEPELLWSWHPGQRS